MPDVLGTVTSLLGEWDGIDESFESFKLVFLWVNTPWQAQ